MRRGSVVGLAILALIAVALAMAGPAAAQQKKIVCWTHWEQNPDFNRWYETKGKEFAALPCGKSCPGAGQLFPWANLVYTGSPNKRVAWEFIRFISNAKDDLEQHQVQGILPVWTANHETQYVKSRPDYQAVKDMLAQPVPPTYFHPKSNELATAFGEAVVGVLYGKGQPKAMLDEAAGKMDRILKD